jgi:hypothetical protein
VSTSRINRPTFWIALLGVVGVIWAVLPLLQGSDPTPEAPATPPAVENTWVPEPATNQTSETSPPAEEEPAPETTATTGEATSTTIAAPGDHSEDDPVVHSEEEPADQPTLAAVPPDTPTETLEALADAVEARLVAELTGAGREVYEGVVWRNEPCCVSVTITGLVADFGNPQLVRVIVEWETDLGEGSGPTYWVPDSSGSWSLASVETSP